MLDMSFSEIAVIGVVALVVLGPERLPKVARTAGQLFGRLQRYVATVKADINREMDSSELAKIKQEVQDAAKSFEDTVQQHANSVEKETVAISKAVEVETPATAEVAPPVSQSAMLAAQESGVADVLPAEVKAPPLVRAQPTSDHSTTPDYAMQGNLDFGIEPVRVGK